MTIEGEAKRLRIYIGETDQWHGQALFTALVERCKREGLAGATVLRAIMGYGAHSRMHFAHILQLSEDLPLLVEVVDEAEKIDRILPILREMVSGGLITLEPVQVVHYAPHPEPRPHQP